MPRKKEAREPEQRQIRPLNAAKLPPRCGRRHAHHHGSNSHTIRRHRQRRRIRQPNKDSRQRHAKHADTNAKIELHTDEDTRGPCAASRTLPDHCSLNTVCPTELLT